MKIIKYLVCIQAIILCTALFAATNDQAQLPTDNADSYEQSGESSDLDSTSSDEISSNTGVSTDASPLEHNGTAVDDDEDVPDESTLTDQDATDESDDTDNANVPTYPLSIFDVTDNTDSVNHVFTTSASEFRNRIVVSVMLNGIGPYPFLLDTAIRRPVVAVEVAEYLELSGSARSMPTEDHAGNPFEVTAALLESFSFAGMPEQPETVAIMDLTALSARLGTRIAGILPAYQPGFEVSIDFDGPSVTWRSLAVARLDAPDTQTALTAIDASGAPRVNVRVNGTESIPMIIDINLPVTVAIPEDTLLSLNVISDMTPRIMTVASAWQGETQVRLDSVQAAGALIRRPVCRVMTAGSTPRLGLDFLRHFRVTLNYEYGLLRLERTGSRILEEASLVGYGIALAHVAFGYWQLQVATGSPAYEAGIRTGDFLIGINEQPANTAYWPDSGYQFLSRLLRADEGDTISLVTMRDNVQYHSYLMARLLMN